jgi:glycosyltransferase involved in cell wall biosynthesis
VKIAIYSVLNLSNGAGGENWIKNVALRLHQRGHSILVLTTKHGDMRDPGLKQKLIDNGITVIELDNYENVFKLPKIRLILKLIRKLRGYEILYFNNAFALNEVLVYFLKVVCRIPVLAGYHGLFPETGGLLRRLYLVTINQTFSGLFDGHHVLNKERLNLLILRGYRNVVCLPNGVDMSTFQPSDKDFVFTVMFAGSMIAQKGVDRFARVVETINDSLKSLHSIRFIIFGSGPMADIPRTLQIKYNNVTYYGYESKEVLQKAYSRSHVFVSPSRFDEFPLSPLEAQASGTPVVATSVSGTREIIIEGQTGFLVEDAAISKIVERILFLRELWYEKTSRYHEYSMNSRSSAEKYKWDLVVDKLLGIFEDLTIAKESR